LSIKGSGAAGLRQVHFHGGLRDQMLLRNIASRFSSAAGNFSTNFTAAE
jgi:hypothetical protein